MQGNTLFLLSMAWITALIMLILVLFYAWKQLGSFGKAWITMLLVGKLIAGVYYIVGLDAPWIILRFRNGVTVTITIAEAVFLTFLLTLATTIMIVVYGRILPREIREALSPEGVSRDEL